MYTVKPTKQYRKSLKRLVRSGSFDASAFETLVDMLTNGRPLTLKHQNHPLHGEYADCFECHIKSDLLLIYRIEEEKNILSILNIGSHSDLFE